MRFGNQFVLQLQPPSATCGRVLQQADAQTVTESAVLVSLNQIFNVNHSLLTEDEERKFP